MKPPIQFIPLHSMGILQFKGTSVAHFLQGQLTCDVEKMDETRAVLGAHCNLQGRVLFSFRLFYYQDHYYVCLPKLLLEQARVTLQKYAKFSKVTIHDISDSMSVYGLIGDTQKQDEGCWRHVEGDTPRFLGIVSTAQQTEIHQQYADCLTQENSWHHAEMMAGIVTIAPQTSGVFTPHALNYPALGAVSFNKGCYTGQEIVARMEYLGKRKEHLYALQLLFSEIPSLVDGLQDETGKEVGKIADFCENIDNTGWMLLAVVAVSAMTMPIYYQGHVVN